MRSGLKSLRRMSVPFARCNPMMLEVPPSDLMGGTEGLEGEILIGPHRRDGKDPNFFGLVALWAARLSSECCPLKRLMQW